MTESVLLAQARPHDDNHHTSCIVFLEMEGMQYFPAVALLAVILQCLSCQALVYAMPSFITPFSCCLLPHQCFLLNVTACKILHARFCMQDSACKILHARFCMQDSPCKILQCLLSGACLCKCICTKETIQKAGNMLPAFWIVSLVLLACTRKRKASSVVTSFKKGGGVICIFLGVGPIFKLEYIKIRRA